VKKAHIYQQNLLAGLLEELGNEHWRFTYQDGYNGRPISLTMPLTTKVHEFTKFPPVFEGLLPEGLQLDTMLRLYKLDRNDLFGQLLLVGADVVGSLTIEPAE
jgi:serine/threonine-protein kinase HipA